MAILISEYTLMRTLLIWAGVEKANALKVPHVMSETKIAWLVYAYKYTYSLNPLTSWPEIHLYLLIAVLVE